MQTIHGHTARVRTLAVGLDGNVHSASDDGTIRVWSGDDGTHLHTLDRDADQIFALVVGMNGKLYSGHESGTVLMWR